MFTGIIEEIGRIENIEARGGKSYYKIACSKINNGLKIGDSVACNGICLTLIDFNDRTITIEAMHETISKTTIKDWALSSKINLERALQFSSRLDGHIVQGHIDTLATVLEVSKVKDTKYIEIELNEAYQDLVVPQGSIAVNGVSLTLANLSLKSFKVALISLTENLTNLTYLRNGDKVNLEFDIVGKYILRRAQLAHASKTSKISKEWLYEQGF